MTFSQSTIVLAQAVTIVNEAVMNEASLPGRFVEVVNASGVGNFQNQATASAAFEKQILIENDLLGYGVSKAADSGTTQRTAVLHTGDRCNARLAVGVTGIVPGTALESAGGGKLRVYTSGTKIGIALVTQTNATAVADDLQAIEIV